jgi:hypothetical protein
MTDFNRGLKLVSRFLLHTLRGMIEPVPDFISLVDDLKDSEESLSLKIDRAHSALQETSALVGRLQEELDEKVKRVQILKNEHEKYAVLATVEETKARALLSQLDATLNKGKSSERMIAFGINILAGLILFVLGVAAGPWLQELLGVGT